MAAILSNITTLFGREEFFYTSPLPPHEFAAAIHALCVRNPYIGNSSGLTGKTYGKAFEISSVYNMRFRGTGDTRSAWLDGTYSEAPHNSTRVHIWITPNVGYGMFATLFSGIRLLLLIVGGILYGAFRLQTGLHLAFGDMCAWVAPVLPALFVSYTKRSLKNDFVTYFRLTPSIKP